MYSQRKSVAKRTLALLLFFTLLAIDASNVVGDVTDAGDVQALKQVKMGVNAASIMPSSCMGSWNFSADPCNARSSPQFACGIDCSPGRAGVFRVTGIMLESGAGYRGALSPFIGNLSALQRLVISGNSFEGPIPDTLAKLSGLIQLDVSVNSFTGYLPASLGLLQNLDFFSVAYNNLEGPIPPAINKMVKTTQMYLNNNRFTGSVPTLTGLMSLYYLDASNNKLSGNLPLGFPPSIGLLALRGNQLSGRLPQGLKSLTQLQALDLRNNQLSGSVDATILTLPSLQQLNLSYNLFTSLGVLQNLSGANSQLLSLDLSFNRIRGPLPQSMVGLKKLRVLALRSNMFTGPIPYQYALKAANTLSGTDQLGQLYLDNNYLSGDIPSPLLNVSSDSISANLVNNCLRSCPTSLFFCQGGGQKTQRECKAAYPDA